MNLEEVLNPQGMAETQPQEQEAQQPPADDGGEGAPAAPQTQERHVPLAALEAERTQRQDWKEKAIRNEEEAKQLRQQLEQFQRQPQVQQHYQPQPIDPLQQVQQQLVNERFNTSEMLVKAAHADADQVVEVFMEAARANPALAAALHQQRHPWDFAYKEGKRLAMLKEVGDDPAAYRAKVEAEIRAQLQTQAAPQLQLPQSLNGARSVAPRSAPAWTGPPPLTDIFRN